LHRGAPGGNNRIPGRRKKAGTAQDHRGITLPFSMVLPADSVIYSASKFFRIFFANGSLISL
jgi:hypothetical protein